MKREGWRGIPLEVSRREGSIALATAIFVTVVLVLVVALS